MRIFSYNDGLQKIEKAYLRQSRTLEQKKALSESDKVKKTDEIILSQKASDLQKYEELAKSIPEIKEDRTKTIKDQIESGRYNINGKTIAKSIIDLIG